MMEGLKPYLAMKDSGVPWLGEVPEHWELRPISALGSLFKGNGGNKDDQISAGVPCVRYGDLYTKHEYFITSSKACVSEERAADYTSIRYSDVLFAASGETMEDIGRSAVNLIQGEARCGGDILVLRPEVPAVPRYLGYAADSPASRNQKACMGRGFTVVHIYGSQLKRLLLPLPPLPEQAAIVRFLDHADRRIRRYIRAKQKLIKLLEEQKQAIIHRAVTRGLDPDVRLKPSGVEWLGDVPEHWTVASLRHRYDQCLGKMLDTKKASGKYPTPYLRNVDVRWDSINVRDLPLIDIAPEERSRFTLRIGDLLVCEGRHLGRAAFWRGQLEVCGFQKALHRLRPLDSARDNPRFLYYCLLLVHVLDAFGASSQDNSIPHLTGEMLRAHRFPFPPRQEQDAIASYLDEGASALMNATRAARGEVGLMRELRTRLISDVVTGKLDVRDAAARLPEHPGEPEPLEGRDDLDSELDKEALDDDAVDEAEEPAA